MSLDGQQRERGVLLVGHGTRDEVGTAQFFELGRRLVDRLSPTPVESALLEFQRPTIPEAWQSLVARGVRRIDLAPLLLFAAGHAKQDIPQIVAECQRATPHVSVQQSRPISRHRSIIDLVLDRLSATIADLTADPDRLAVVMVGRGSHDPCAQADMRVLSEIVGRRAGAASTVTAFYAMAEPRLPAVLQRVAACGRFDAVVVHPHLLFEGRLYQAIKERTDEIASRHRSIRFRVSPYLGPDPRVVDALATRIEQIQPAID